MWLVQRRELLALAEHSAEQVAALGQPVHDVRMVKPSGRSDGSSSSSQAIGADTGAPGAARGLYGATSVLLIAFWV